MAHRSARLRCATSPRRNGPLASLSPQDRRIQAAAFTVCAFGDQHKRDDEEQAG
jgi:hypothetical protein